MKNSLIFIENIMNILSIDTEFRLELIWKYLQMNALDIRIHALNSLNNIILHEDNKANTGILGLFNKNINQMILHFIQQYDLLNYIYTNDKNIHYEIISRTLHIYIFLINIKELTINDIYKLWSLIYLDDLHQSIEHLIYKMFTYLSKVFVKEHFIYCFNHLKYTTDKLCLLLLKTMTINYYEKIKEYNNNDKNGMDIIYTMLIYSLNTDHIANKDDDLMMMILNLRIMIILYLKELIQMNYLHLIHLLIHYKMIL